MKKIFLITFTIFLIAASCNSSARTFGSQSECEQKTGKQCVDVLCDIPPCDNIKTGWQPTLEVQK